MFDQLREQITSLAGEVDSWSPEELINAQRSLQRLSHAVYATQLEVDAATDRAGIPTDHGFGSMRNLLVGMHRLPRSAAKTRDHHREVLASGRSLQGEELVPNLSSAAEALREGAIGAAHVDVIDEFIERLPDGMDLETRLVAEKEITALARTYSPRETMVLARDLLARLDPEDNPPDPDLSPPPSGNELRWGHTRTGRLRFVGEFSADGGATLCAAIDALAQPVADDTRDLPHRRGDALVTAAQIALTTGDVPEHGGERPHLNITIGLRDLQQRTGHGQTDDGALLHPEKARMHACDARVVPVVLGSESQPLDVGRATRTVPPAIRRALVVRADGRCEQPGCDRPASQCHGHHIVHWADGGETKIENLVMLCGHHHLVVHRTGWIITVNPRGQPTFTPPAIIDPTRTSRNR